MRKRVAIAAAGAGAVLAVTAGGVAVGTSGDDGPVSHQYTQEQADAASEAALEATGGGTVNSVETDDENGATYEVEVTRPDGTTVDVRLDEHFEVVVIEGDSEDSDGS
ncbi:MULTISPECIES: PepSY domain-containing protein [unclassified Nocardioides]|uniref:PepSY domain-containing protein n=1 Tax=unclassified Nocardioides TaxID=2615069 RepID=UPI00360B7AAD